jgi:hypothetical protein
VITIGRSTGKHKWLKLNSYHVCIHCGIKANELKLGYMTLKRGTNPIKAICQYAPININFDYIEIIKCDGYGKNFIGLVEGKIKKVIKDNPKLINDVRGVWIHGAYKPVKLLYNEFKIIKK